MTEIGDDLLLELGSKGSCFSRMEGDLRCPRGGIFLDDLPSGRRTDFRGIWSGGCCWMD